MPRLLLLLSLFPLILPAAVRGGENWPEFRGPTADGHADATGLPLTWSEKENVVWKTELDGRAWSSPVVWGDQIWVTNAPESGKQMSAVCLDRKTGKIAHSVKVWDVPKPGFVMYMNSYASCTPAIEEGRVYVHFGRYGTACLDTASGKVLWTRRDLLCNHHRGPASSPILFEDLLIVQFDGFDIQYVVALNKTTGKTVWKQDRNIIKLVTNGDRRKAYGTPSIIDVDGQLQLISPCASAAISYNPRTGEELWRVRCGGMNVCARPIYGHGLVYLNTAAGGWKQFAVRPTGRGDVTDSHVAWKFGKSVPTRPSQLLVGDLLFMVNDAGVASCLQAKTGEAVWQNRIGGKHSASPIYADGRIYFFSEEGDTTVIAPTRQFKSLAINHLEGRFMASPAVVGKSLILRTHKAIYRVEKK